MKSTELSKQEKEILERQKRIEFRQKVKLEERVKGEIIAKSNAKNSPGIMGESIPNRKKSLDLSSPVHKTDDSKSHPNFFQRFRRENSDFFPLFKRHSTILGETIGNNLDSSSGGGQSQQQRSSVLLQLGKRHGGYNGDEPILMDYVLNSEQLNATLRNNINNKDFIRPRREKTESVIVRNSTTKQQLLNMQSDHQVNVQIKIVIDNNL